MQNLKTYVQGKADFGWDDWRERDGGEGREMILGFHSLVLALPEDMPGEGNAV